MKGDKELVGILRGFDDYVNMVLEDVTEYTVTPNGKKIQKVDSILLNGKNVCLLVPGGAPQDNNENSIESEHKQQTNGDGNQELNNDDMDNQSNVQTNDNNNHNHNDQKMIDID